MRRVRLAESHESRPHVPVRGQGSRPRGEADQPSQVLVRAGASVNGGPSSCLPLTHDTLRVAWQTPQVRLNHAGCHAGTSQRQRAAREPAYVAAAPAYQGQARLRPAQVVRRHRVQPGLPELPRAGRNGQLRDVARPVRHLRRQPAVPSPRPRSGPIGTGRCTVPPGTPCCAPAPAPICWSRRRRWRWGWRCAGPAAGRAAVDGAARSSRRAGSQGGCGGGDGGRHGGLQAGGAGRREAHARAVRRAHSHRLACAVTVGPGHHGACVRARHRGQGEAAGALLRRRRGRGNAAAGAGVDLHLLANAPGVQEVVHHHHGGCHRCGAVRGHQDRGHRQGHCLARAGQDGGRRHCRLERCGFVTRHR